MNYFKGFYKGALALLLFSSGNFSYGQDVKLATDSELGEILTDTDGNTLYFFTKDVSTDDSKCNGGCITNWPVFYVDSPTFGDGLDASDFSSMTRSGDGELQMTYKGWPLYYFAGDSDPGDTNGETVLSIWYAAKPDYSIFFLNDSLVGADGMSYDTTYVLGHNEGFQFFVDDYGRSLYFWVNDLYNDNNFTNEDFSNNGVWPIYEEDLGSIPSDLDPELFSTTDVYGHTQITYKGNPIYYFGGDGAKGETKGVSVPGPGIWPIAKRHAEALINLAGIETIDYLNSLSVYPNPATNAITIDSDIEINSIRILNTLGETILSEDRINNFSQTIPVSSISTGIYILEIKTDNGAVTKRISIK